MTVDLFKVAEIVLKISAVIGALGVIISIIKKYLDKLVDKIQKPIIKKIDSLDNELTKNYLVEFLNDVKNGIEKTDYQTERAHEAYRHYTEDLKGNSYIHTMWTKYMKGEEDHEGKNI